MIEIGSLVKFKNFAEIGIVIDHWIDDTDGDYCPIIKWLNGVFVGKRTAEYNEDLEVIA